MIMLQENIGLYKEAVVQFLNTGALEGFPQNLKDSTHHIMTLPGKRLRPIVVLMIAKSYGVEIPKAISAAVAVEVFHNFTLVHDDIMDKAPLRRGQITVHEKYGEPKAIVTGDAMLPHSIGLLIQGNEAKTSALIESFLKMAKEVMEGQQFDMDFETQENVTLNEYLNMIRLKTSVLFGCACEIGAILGDATPEDQQKMYDFGLYSGLAFQIMDDYLDTFGDASFGKRIGGDILLNKKTFLLINAIEKANSTQKEKIAALFNEKDEAKKIEGFQSIFKEIGVDQIALDKMQEYHNLSVEAVKTSSLSDDNKQELIEFGEMMLRRTK